MSRLPGLYQWNAAVAKRFSHLSKPMAACLALWSLGMIIARSCSLTAVAWAWEPILKVKFHTLRERLRDLYREAPAKAGSQRRRTRPRHLLGTVVGLGHRRLARQATRLGLGCDHPGTTIYRVGRERSLPRLCGPGGLENLESHRSPCLGTGMGKRCWAISVRSYRPIGKSSYWRTEGCTPSGSFKRLRRWAGIRCCASITKANSVPKAGITGSISRKW